MALTFANKAQQLTHQRVSEYLVSSMFRDTMRIRDDQPRFDLLYQDATLIQVDVLPWEVNPWEQEDLATVRAFSYITVGNANNLELIRFLMAENNKIRFGAFQIDEAGQVVFAHSILGGESMDLRELQTCILSVAAIANSYEDLIVEEFGGQRIFRSLDMAA
jgi:hypothetical protein